MFRPKLKNSSQHFTLITALLLIAFIYLIMAAATGCNMASSSYNSYELQAEAWLHGSVALEQNREDLSLAFYGGNYYVASSPIPSVPHFIWLLIFGSQVPFGIFQKLYACAACLLIISELIRRRCMPEMHAMLWGFGFCFASTLLPVSLIGGVWYEAQSLAFLLAAVAVVSMRRDHPTVSCIAYALSVGCKPLAVCLGPVLLVMYLRKHRRETRKAFLRLLPGMIAGFILIGVYAWYNLIRFGNILEFGFGYLSNSANGINALFSLSYIPQNALRVLFGLPFVVSEGKLAFTQSGFSMFIGNPILLCGAVWMIRDIIRHRMTYVKWTAIIMGCLHFLLNLAHQLPDTVQFGIPHSIELIPYVLIWYLASPDRRRMRYWEATLLLLGLILNIVGGICVHIPT